MPLSGLRQASEHVAADVQDVRLALRSVRLLAYGLGLARSRLEPLEPVG